MSEPEQRTQLRNKYAENAFVFHGCIHSVRLQMLRALQEDGPWRNFVTRVMTVVGCAQELYENGVTSISTPPATERQDPGKRSTFAGRNKSLRIEGIRHGIASAARNRKVQWRFACLMPNLAQTSLKGEQSWPSSFSTQH